ncbi:MAG: fabG 2 [Massilia sp.]|jgi:3-oxoacyl-[acyl-carrier protein] reductase|nr:fabG 2 [Massilia sp.]
MSSLTPHSQVALVTGAGRNIGRAIALALAGAGAAVAVNVRSSVEEGQSVVDEIVAAGGRAILCVADVTVREQVDAMIAQIEQTYGRLDILVNNAAVRDEAEFGQLDYASWRHAMSVCLDGAFHCTQAALALLQESRNGSVINIGGLTAHTGASHRVHVVTAKAGLVGMTRALAHELAPSGITVNCLSPGLIDTQRHGAAPAPNHHATRTNLVGRRGQPSEIGEAVLWLAGAGGRYVTGQTIHLNGGAYLGG